MKNYQEVTQENIKNGMEYILPLEIIPNQLGINLCSVKGIEYEKQDDGQLLYIKIDFIPSE